jgi:5-(carboxyamino)imidazole ribonucleotide synthase
MTFPLPPGSSIGILGGGQLGRMLALAAARLGFDVVILEPEADSPASRVASRTIQAAYDDPKALAELAACTSVITYEFENVPAAAVALLAELGAEVAPNARSLAVAQDRVAEKLFLNESGVATVRFAPVANLEELAEAVGFLGVPSLLKTRRDGYDGKGQHWVEHPVEAEGVFQGLGAKASILEAAADFTRELSIIAARGRGGEVAVYPLGENHHEQGILRRTRAPARLSEATAAQAIEIAHRVVGNLDYVGVIGIELFEVAEGHLLVNEIAPRVHNTGHWTQDGCAVDQFEQHIRAVAGWPLGPTEALCHVEMLNLLGSEVETWPKLSTEADTRLHLYGKRDAKPGRKMGHVNRLSPL